jgi:uncharacterized protein (DUF2249 family)
VVTISPGDRVARVLEQDERLIDVFAAASPAFERLRNPATRRVMARLVTVEQAARLAGVDAALLVERLNAALAGNAPAPTSTPDPTEPVSTTPTTAELPPAFAHLPEERITDLDVRPALRRGEEPFSHIMAAKAALPDGNVLRLRAIFEPVPLYHVLAKQGFAYWTEKLADDDWRVWFYRADAAPSSGGAVPAAPAAPAAVEEDAGEDVIVLDVRGLEPPEPMVRTLAALEALPRGKTLLQINVRTPQFLLPRLAEQGFVYEVREQNEDLVRVFIRHAPEA